MNDEVFQAIVTIISAEYKNIAEERGVAFAEQFANTLTAILRTREFLTRMEDDGK